MFGYQHTEHIECGRRRRAPCTGGVGGVGETGGRDTQHNIFLAPGKAEGTVFTKVANNFIVIEIIIRPEKCDAGSNKAKSKEQIDLGKWQGADHKLEVASVLRHKRTKHLTSHCIVNFRSHPDIIK